MLTLAFCDCVGIQSISWGCYQNVNEISHQAVPVNWVMNENFISLQHGTRVLVRITVANLFYTPKESILIFLGRVCENCCLYQHLMLHQNKIK